MKLFPLNKNVPILEKCGYGNVLEYTDPNFYGHQKGVAICIINKNTNIIEKNMLSENLKDRDKLLQAILESKNIAKIVDEITQFENGKLVPKGIFYLPYMVSDHSVFKPTVNWDNVSGGFDVKLNIEILFVHEHLNRYITTNVTTDNVSIMDAIYNMFEDNDLLQKELPLHGFKYQEKPDEEGMQGWIIDFYDEAGGKHEYCFSTGERLRDAIVSVRLIGITEVKNGAEEI